MVLDWHWLPKQFGFADGGSYSKLLDAQAPVHDLVAREVTQNSWDAARRLRSRLATQNVATDALPRFKLVYDFKIAIGNQKNTVLNALRLDQLQGEFHTVGHKNLGFQAGSTVLDLANPDAPLDLLYISDYGATGLQGDPVGEDYDESDFYRAFGQIGGNDREEGGGSFGFGKAAFIKASRIRCVVAYSSFLGTEGDPTTRRLWGFVYWKGHRRRSGIAQLGQLVQDADVQSRPLTDDAADVVAESLGFAKRNANSPEECGTSLLIVDHVLDPDSLTAALSKFWWPALEEFRDSFDVQVRSAGKVTRPKPRQDIPELIPYLRAFEIARDPNAQLMKHEMKPAFQKLESGLSIGRLALVKGDPDQARFHDDGSYAHVALIRNPRMVVDYLPLPGSSPNTTVCGVFVASDEVDAALRKSEPASHNEWSCDIDESYGEGWELAREVATAVRDRVKKNVRKFQKELRGSQAKHRVPLSVANDILATIFPDRRSSPEAEPKKGKKKTKIKKVPGFYASTRKDQVLRIEDPGLVSVAETWQIQILESVKKEVTFDLAPRVWALSDGRSAEASDQLDISQISATCGFEKLSSATLRFSLAAGTVFEVSFISSPYNENWSTKSDLVIDRVDAPKGAVA